MSQKFWEVVGGEATGGILVRTGRDPSSPQAASRISTGALLREVELAGERLSYERLTGTGPDSGWVALRVKGNELVAQVGASKAAKKQSLWAASESERKERLAKVNEKRGAAGLEDLEEVREREARERLALAPVPSPPSAAQPAAQGGDDAPRRPAGPAPELAPIPRSRRFPAPADLGKRHAALFRDRKKTGVRMHFYIFYGSGDYVSTWYQFVNGMPDSIDIAVFERAGQGSREGEAMPESIEAVARDAIEGMAPALNSYRDQEGARFALLGHSTGGPIMSEVARLVRQDFGVEACCLVPLDEAPPNELHLSDYGYKLLVESPDQWLAEWNPHIKDPQFYIHDNRIYNEYRNNCPEYPKLHCDILTVASAQQQEVNDYYQKAKADGTLKDATPEQHALMDKRRRRARLYRSSAFDSLSDFPRESYEKWAGFTSGRAEVQWFDVAHQDMKFHDGLTKRIAEFLVSHLG